MARYIKLEPCPLCGRPAHHAQLYSHADSIWNISCGSNKENDDPAEANGCGLVLFGDSGRSRNEMAKQWNQRSEKWERT